MLSTAISPSLLHQTVVNLALNLISPDFSYFSRLFKHLLIQIFYWSVPWLHLLTLGSAEKLYIRAEFTHFLCTEKGVTRKGRKMNQPILKN